MNREDQITIIVGAQWGDEGKGKITDLFAEQADVVVRFQGGNNAGHTIVVNGQTYKLHLVPSGVLYPKATAMIGSGVVVDPRVLLDELHSLENRGIHPRLLVDERAHVILPYHIAMDEGLTEFQGALAAGSTKRGIAPVYADKMYRHGIRLGDLVDPPLFHEKLEKAYAFNVGILKNVFGKTWDVTAEAIEQEYLGFGQQLKPYLADTSRELLAAVKRGERILFEASQGMSLDVDHGMYPHTTSIHTTAGYVACGTGVGLNSRARILGVAKAYVTRVGVSPFPTEIEGELAHTIREAGQEYGTTTGRPRRVGWLDLVQLRQAVRVNGCTDIAIMKLDVLSGLPEIKVAVGYTAHGKRIDEMPASLSLMRSAAPVYETLEGWTLSRDQLNTIIAQGFQALPGPIQQFVTFIEERIGCRISVISLGPERHETLFR